MIIRTLALNTFRKSPRCEHIPARFPIADDDATMALESGATIDVTKITSTCTEFYEKVATMTNCAPYVSIWELCSN